MRGGSLRNSDIFFVFAVSHRKFARRISTNSIPIEFFTSIGLFKVFKSFESSGTSASIFADGFDQCVPGAPRAKFFHFQRSAKT
jgi:hypothetical protein